MMRVIWKTEALMWNFTYWSAALFRVLVQRFSSEKRQKADLLTDTSH